MDSADLFSQIKSFSSVQKVSNFYPNGNDLYDLVFFVCPRISGKGIKINKANTGFTASYRDGMSEYSRERFVRVSNFLTEIRSIGLRYSLTTIFAAADSYLLFPIPADPPEIPSPEFIPDGFELVSNLQIYRNFSTEFGYFYRDCIWKKTPQWARKLEIERLAEILPINAPENLKTDFTDRCFAGFALDGLVLKQGIFGPNPVILGVESLGVSVLQNAALEKPDWIPVIDLV